MIKFHSRGFSALEVLASLSLIMLIGMLSLPGLHGLATVIERSAKFHRIAIVHDTTSSLLRSYNERSMFLDGLPTTRALTPTAFASYLEEQYPKLLSSPSGAPDPNSGAIFYLLPSIKPFLRVASITSGGEVLACGQTTAGTVNTNIWIGVTPDGFLELRGSLKKSKNNASLCPGLNVYRGTLTAQPKSLFFTDPSAVGTQKLLPPTLTLLIPVTEALGFYLSKQHELRRLNYISQDHQPVLPGLAKFNLSISDNAHLVSITLQAVASDRSEHLVLQTSARTSRTLPILLSVGSR